MDLIFILFYLLVFLVGFFAIFFSFNLFKAYTFDFLRVLNYFVIFSVIFSFFNWIAPEIISAISKDLTNISGPFLIILSKTLGYPFLIFKLYFLFQLGQKLGPREVKAWPKYLFLTLLLLLLIIHPMITINFFKDQLGDFGKFFKRLEGHFLVAIQYMLLFSLMIKTRPYQKTNPKYSGKIFGFWYLIGFSTAVLTVTYKITLTMGYYISIFLFFIILFPPLIFIQFFLKKHHGLASPDQIRINSLKSFGQDYNITGREQEIIHLILMNKTNQEIEDALYVSMQTVKNNISNIYKKAEVKNRQHLIRKVKDHLYRQSNG